MLNRRAVLGGLAASLAASRLRAQEVKPEYWAPHWDARAMWMQARVEQEGTGGLALVGDSIMETVNWTSLGMHRTVNMGFGGARTRNILQRIEKPLKTVKPDAAILMASINNAVKGLPEDEVKAYEAEYFVLVRKLKAATPKVALMTVMPVEAGKSNSPFYDGFYVPILNKVIRHVGKAEGLKVYDAYSLTAEEDGQAAQGSTTDGVHLSKASYEKLRALYTAAAADLLG